MMTRLIVLAVFGTLTAGTGYMTYFGVGGESSDVSRSIRSASTGNAAFVRVK